MVKIPTNPSNIAKILITHDPPHFIESEFPNLDDCVPPMVNNNVIKNIFPYSPLTKGSALAMLDNTKSM